MRPILRQPVKDDISHGGGSAGISHGGGSAGIGDGGTTFVGDGGTQI